jgi:hypothetical protein
MRHSRTHETCGEQISECIHIGSSHNLAISPGIREDNFIPALEWDGMELGTLNQASERNCLQRGGGSEAVKPPRRDGISPGFAPTQMLSPGLLLLFPPPSITARLDSKAGRIKVPRLGFTAALRTGLRRASLVGGQKSEHGKPAGAGRPWANGIPVQGHPEPVVRSSSRPRFWRGECHRSPLPAS